jgi:hypothetical protein
LLAIAPRAARRWPVQRAMAHTLRLGKTERGIPRSLPRSSSTRRLPM